MRILAPALCALVALAACSAKTGNNHDDGITAPVNRTGTFERNRLGMEGIDITTYPAPSRVLLRLPWVSGATAVISLGYNGWPTHTGSQSFALDFNLDEGTPVHAARGGTVITAVQHFIEGGVEERLRDAGNYVEIRHDDGTIARYYHLMHNGARVAAGQTVAAGDLVGLCGQTGYTAAPHIHFFVWGNEARTNSIPVFFMTSAGPMRIVEGLKYTAPRYDAAGRPLAPTNTVTPELGLYANAPRILVDLVNSATNRKQATVAFTAWLVKHSNSLRSEWKQVLKGAMDKEPEASKKFAAIMRIDDFAASSDLARILDPENPDRELTDEGCRIWNQIMARDSE